MLLKKRGLRAIGIIYLILGAFFLLNSFQGITGFAILKTIPYSANSIIAIVFIVTGILLLISGGRNREGDLVRKIIPKKELKGWSLKDLIFRRKLINLFDQQREIHPNKIRLVLDRYKEIEDTGDKIRGKRGAATFNVYSATNINNGKREYFTIDHAESFNLYLGKGRTLPVPYHIDIQEKVKNGYKKLGEIDIPWDYHLEKNKDVLHYFGVRKEKMLEDLHKGKSKGKPGSGP
jgi:hypothetical protein